VSNSAKILVKPGVEFKVKAELPTVAYVKGDPHRLTQCVNNFISNAAKFTSRGEIVFAISEGERNRDKGTIQLRFSIVDTGIGMTPETVTRLFQPFTQV